MAGRGAGHPGFRQRHRVDIIDAEEQIAAATAWYRERLAEPAVLPWDPHDELAPVLVGPTWEVDRTGHWVLPEFSAGWGILGHLSYYLNGSFIGLPRWEFTLEQARYMLWDNAVELDGKWLFLDGTLQRVKGWGKDPIIAADSLGVITGPVKVLEVNQITGEVLAEQHPNPLVQIAATAADQTRTTMDLFAPMTTPEYRAAFGIQVLRTMVHAREGLARIEALTRNPERLEGFRGTKVWLNETHLWTPENRGAAMDQVIRRNMRKVPGARARRATNAPRSGDNVAWVDREKSDLGELEKHLYDSLEANPRARLNVEDGVQVIPMVRGDSTWLTVEMFLGGINDPRDSDELKRRFWYNQVGGDDEDWVARQAWLDCRSVDRPLVRGDQVVLFGDGSKSGDYTAIAGCRISDGLLFTVGVWKPVDGRVSRERVSLAVHKAFDELTVIGFWFDPGGGEDDEEERPYWLSTCDSWAEELAGRLKLRADAQRHAIVWDMRDRRVKHKAFVRAAEQFIDDVESGQLIHDGSKALTKHVLNAKTAYTDDGISLRKPSRHSQRKIDLAVAAVGARMMRRIVLLDPERYLPKSYRVV